MEAGGGVRGGKLPEFGGIREYEALFRTLRSLRKRRVRRIEYADARPPLHLEFIRLGCSKYLLWGFAVDSFGLLRMFAMVFARTSSRFCQDFARVWRWKGLQIAPPQGQNCSSEGKNSSSDRPGDSQEQPKSLQDNKFWVSSCIFKHFWKILKPKSAQERPKSCLGAPRRIPE